MGSRYISGNLSNVRPAVERLAGRFVWPMLNIKVTHNFDAFITELVADTVEVKERVMVRAINKMADQVKVASAREIRDAGYNLRIAEIKRNIRISYASAGRLRATVTARGRPIPLIQYNARQVGNGVSVSVKAGRKVIGGAFIATMPSGHRGVYVREPGARHRKVNKGDKPGWHALPIRELFGPSIPDGMANEAVQEALQRLIVEKFPELLRRERSWALRSALR